MAHIADVIYVYENAKQSSDVDLWDIMYLYKSKFITSGSVFTHNEDERITNALINIYDRDDFSGDQLTKWIRSFNDIVLTDVYTDDMYIKINAKLLLRSLYFSLIEKENSTEFLNEILIQLKKM